MPMYCSSREAEIQISLPSSSSLSLRLLRLPFCPQKWSRSLICLPSRSCQCSFFILGPANLTTIPPPLTPLSSPLPMLSARRHRTIEHLFQWLTACSSSLAVFFRGRLDLVQYFITLDAHANELGLQAGVHSGCTGSLPWYLSKSKKNYRSRPPELYSSQVCIFNKYKVWHVLYIDKT